MHPAAREPQPGGEGFEIGSPVPPGEQLRNHLQIISTHPAEAQIAVVWYCVKANDDRLTPADIAMIRELAERDLPVILVLTKVDWERNPLTGTRHGGRIAMSYHSQEFARDQRHLLITDMLYPGLTPEHFQVPIAKMGFRTVWDIRKTRESKDKDKAIHGVVDDAIAVDGCLYLKWMPEHLINATVDFRREPGDPKKIDEATYYAR